MIPSGDDELEQDQGAARPIAITTTPEQGHGEPRVNAAPSPAQPIATTAAGLASTEIEQGQGELRAAAAPQPAQSFATSISAICDAWDSGRISTTEAAVMADQLLAAVPHRRRRRRRRSDRSRHCCYRNIRKFDVPAWWSARPSWRRWIKRQSNKRMRRLGRRLGEDAPTKPYKVRAYKARR